MKGVLLLLAVAILCISLSESLRFRPRRPRGKTCQLPKAVGFCRARIRRYFYNAKTRRCEMFYYGGCFGNSNNFRSLRQCQRKCVVQFKPRPRVEACKLPKVVGFCRGRFRRYFYNSKTSRCEVFYYGGCFGNKNNFRSLYQCQKRCGSSRASDPCKQPVQSGMCLAYFRRYFYNSRTRRCQMFVYGGCGGNRNNFRSLYRCRKTCMRR